MAIFTATVVNSGGQPNAQLIRKFRRWTMLHIQNISTVGARLAVDRLTLEQTVPAIAKAGGMNLPANQTTPIQLWWIGELWLISDSTVATNALTAVNIETMESPVTAIPISPGDRAAQAQVTSAE